MIPIYILNVSGGHGHFLQWLLDKFCVSTPDITTKPFNHLGASHLHYEKSGKFIFIDGTQTKDFLKSNTNKNAIMITIDDEILYWERSYMYRAGNKGTDLFDERSIEKFLQEQGSPFPDFCKQRNISIKEGYKFAFRDLDKCGARLHDNDRKKYPGIENNNVYFFPLRNFLSQKDLKKALIQVSERFKFGLDLSAFDVIYHNWYSQNTILLTNDAVEQYRKGNHSIKLDVLQQAYVDAQS